MIEVRKQPANLEKIVQIPNKLQVISFFYKYRLSE